MLPTIPKLRFCLNWLCSSFERSPFGRGHWAIATRSALLILFLGSLAQSLVACGPRPDEIQTPVAPPPPPPPKVPICVNVDWSPIEVSELSRELENTVQTRVSAALEDQGADTSCPTDLNLLLVHVRPDGDSYRFRVEAEHQHNVVFSKADRCDHCTEGEVFKPLQREAHQAWVVLKGMSEDDGRDSQEQASVSSTPESASSGISISAMLQQSKAKIEREEARVDSAPRISGAQPLSLNDLGPVGCNYMRRSAKEALRAFMWRTALERTSYDVCWQGASETRIKYQVRALFELGDFSACSELADDYHGDDKATWRTLKQCSLRRRGQGGPVESL